MIDVLIKPVCWNKRSVNNNHLFTIKNSYFFGLVDEFSKNFRSRLEILDVRIVTWSKVNTEGRETVFWIARNFIVEANFARKNFCRFVRISPERFLSFGRISPEILSLRRISHEKIFVVSCEFRPKDFCRFVRISPERFLSFGRISPEKLCTTKYTCHEWRRLKIIRWMPYAVYSKS